VKIIKYDDSDFDLDESMENLKKILNMVENCKDKLF